MEQLPVITPETIGAKRTRYNELDTPHCLEFRALGAALINKLHQISSESTDGDVKRLCDLAMTKIEEGVDHAVKAVTA